MCQAAGVGDVDPLATLMTKFVVAQLGPDLVLQNASFHIGDSGDIDGREAGGGDVGVVEGSSGDQLRQEASDHGNSHEKDMRHCG